MKRRTTPSLSRIFVPPRTATSGRSGRSTIARRASVPAPSRAPRPRGGGEPRPTCWRSSRPRRQRHRRCTRGQLGQCCRQPRARPRLARLEPDVLEHQHLAGLEPLGQAAYPRPGRSPPANCTGAPTSSPRRSATGRIDRAGSRPLGRPKSETMHEPGTARAEFLDRGQSTARSECPSAACTGASAEAPVVGTLKSAPQQHAPPVDVEIVERAKPLADRLPRHSDPERRAAVKVIECARSTFTSRPSLVRVVVGRRLPSIRVTRHHAEWMIGNGRRSSALGVRPHAPGCYGIDERGVVAAHSGRRKPRQTRRSRGRRRRRSPGGSRSRSRRRTARARGRASTRTTWRRSPGQTVASPRCRPRSSSPTVDGVEVARREILDTTRLVQPSEEDVAGRLHQPLTLHDPLSLIWELRGADELLEHRARRFLRLQEQRIARVAAEQQDHPAARSHAPHADDLARKVDVAIAPRAVAGDRPARLARYDSNSLPALSCSRAAPAPSTRSPIGHDQRRVREDPRRHRSPSRQAWRTLERCPCAGPSQPSARPAGRACCPAVSAPAPEAR